MKQLQTDPHVQDFIEIIPHRDGIDPDGYSIGVLSDEDKKCSIGWLVNDVGNVFKYLPNLPELVEFYRVSDKTSYLLNRDGEVFSYNNKLHKLRPVRTRDDGSLSLKIYDNKEQVVYFVPGNEPKATFKYVQGAKIYSYCNKHSLWSQEVK